MGILELKNLHKFYGENEVLKGINLEVEKSEVAVILGPSGCGKSTLLRCINGLENIASGEIIIDGERIDKNYTNWTKIRQKVGMVFQSYELFDHLSVEQNILLAPMKVEKRKKDEKRKGMIVFLRISVSPESFSGGKRFLLERENVLVKCLSILRSCFHMVWAESGLRLNLGKYQFHNI